MHPLLRYILIGLPAAVLVFLGLAGFFTAWDGRVVSLRPAADDDPAVYTVLVVTPQGDGTEIDWPADVVQPLGLKADASGVPPTKVPENAPYTRKGRFSMYFTVTPIDGDAKLVPTTSPRSLGGAVLAFLVGLALYNMALSGSPVSWTPRPFELPSPQAPQGQGAPPPAAARSRKGPPPPKSGRGQGRRR